MNYLPILSTYTKYKTRTQHTHNTTHAQHTTQHTPSTQQENLNLKDEIRLSGNLESGVALCSVRVRPGNGKASLLPKLHGSHTIIPTLMNDSTKKRDNVRRDIFVL